MNFRLKGILTALLGLLAMGAIAAQASAHQFETTGSESTVLTGSQEDTHIFSINGVEVTCTTATFAGTTTGLKTNEVHVHPTYGKTGGKCHLGGITVTVDTTGCDYTFSGETTTNPNKPAVEDAPVEISCEEGKLIKLTGACEARVPAQKVHGVHYTNVTENSKDAVTVDATVEGIHSTTTGGFSCFVLGLGSGEKTWENGTYFGKSIVTGWEDTCEPEECPFESEGDKDTYTEGEQVNIRVNGGTEP